MTDNQGPQAGQGVDEIEAALEEMNAKYKKVINDQKLKFLVVDDLVPLLQMIRQEYIEGFAAQQEELDLLGDAEHVENLERFVGRTVEVNTATAILVDGLLKHFGCVDEQNEKTDKFPEAFKSPYDNLRTMLGASMTEAADLMADEDDEEAEDVGA